MTVLRGKFPLVFIRFFLFTDEVGDGGEFPAVGYSAAVTPVQRGLYAVVLGLRF